MGKLEVDEHGRLSLPLKIREKLLIRPGDKLTIKVNPDNFIFYNPVLFSNSSG